jgi:hypothetical protein
MRTGRAAPRCRGVDNWVRVVDSFTGSAYTLYNSMMKELKLIVNTEITGPNGATRSFKGECPPPEPDLLPAGLLVIVICYMRSAHGCLAKGDKCILHHFGKRQGDNASAFRVC